MPGIKSRAHTLKNRPGWKGHYYRSGGYARGGISEGKGLKGEKGKGFGA
jgi:hypothetical protein